MYLQIMCVTLHVQCVLKELLQIKHAQVQPQSMYVERNFLAACRDAKYGK